MDKLKKKPSSAVSYDTPSQVFEITDYTTASDWERFIANLEDILTQWELNKQPARLSKQNDKTLKPGAISRGRWLERSDTMKFGEYPFDIKYRWLDESQDGLYEEPTVITGSEDKNCPKLDDDDDDGGGSDAESDFQDCEDVNNIDDEIFESNKVYGEQELPKDLPTVLLDIMDTKNDFSCRAHCIVRWYNHRRFITITPKNDYIIESEDRVKMLLGSASIALTNIECFVPIFIQLRQPRSNFFQGISEHNNIRTLYEMAYFRQNSHKYQYLSELINLFREKIDCTLNDQIAATIRLNYCLEDFTIDTAQVEYNEQVTFDMNSALSRNWHNDLSNLVTKVKTATESLSTLARERKFYAQFQAALKQLTQSVNNVPILEYIHIGALWPPMSDKVISDTPVHSDLNPAEAPIWTARAVCQETYPNSVASIVGELMDFSVQQCDNSITDVIQAILLVSCNVINEKFTNILKELQGDDISPEYEHLDPEKLSERLQKREFNVIHSTLLTYEKRLYVIQAINDVFSRAINYVYEKLDSSEVMDGTATELQKKCKALSYRLSSQPEVVLSEYPADDIRKLMAILFERQKYNRDRMMSHDPSLSDAVRESLRKDPNVKFDNIITRSYRNFGQDHKPSVKEFILRSNVSRPFSSGITPALPQKMFCTVSDDEFRLCGAFSELCN